MVINLRLIQYGDEHERHNKTLLNFFVFTFSCIVFGTGNILGQYLNDPLNG